VVRLVILIIAALSLASCGREAAQRPATEPTQEIAKTEQPERSRPEAPAVKVEEHSEVVPKSAEAPVAVSFETFLREAMEALEANELDKLKTELKEALEVATDVQKAQIEDILTDLEKGELGEVEEHLAAMLGGAGVEAFLHEAQEALEAGNLDKAKHELEEALEMAADVQKAQIEDILKDLEAGDIEEVKEHLAVLMGATEVSIAPVLHETLEALEAGDLDKAKRELEEALELATGAQKAQLEDIFKDLEKGELEEVEEHLKAMFTETEQAAELALTGVAAEGHELFEQVGCAQCHGQNAEGGFAPGLAGRTRDQVFRQVRTPVGEMPPLSPAQVSDEDLEKIAAFIEALTDERGFTGAAYRHLTAALEKVEEGDIDGALEAVAKAAEESEGAAHAEVEEIEQLLKRGDVAEAEEKLHALIGPGAARNFLVEALEALERGDWEKVEEELHEALEVAEGTTKEAVEDLIQDLEEGKLDEVEEHLKELLGETK